MSTFLSLILSEAGRDLHMLADSTCSIFIYSKLINEKLIYFLCLINCTVKKVIVFPVPNRDVMNQSLRGRKKFYNSRPGRVWLVTYRLQGRENRTLFRVCLMLENQLIFLLVRK